MNDYDVSRNLKTLIIGEENKILNSGVVPGGYCRRCMSTTSTSYGNYNGYIMYHCNFCSKQKWS